ncbi:MAG: type I methionyl aminopeptidase [Opitutales bacterium]|nr:type I methionyl aminopeptidase [Opitutales bacterium]
MASSSSSRGHYRQREDAIPIKSPEEIRLMKEVCTRAAQVLQEMIEATEVGVTTYDLDRVGKKAMEKLGVESACFGYPGSRRPFPSYTCISINDEVVHGIASLDRIVENGDVVSLDVVVKYKGYIGDNARTIIVGSASEENQRLISKTKEAFDVGIGHARSGNRIGDVSHSIQKFVEKAGYSVIREFVGHGVGKTMHEPPQIPNFGRRRTGDLIRPGMTLAIEPMVNMGRKEVSVLDDGWTVTTNDGLPAAHHENTILVLSDGVEVLTKP